MKILFYVQYGNNRINSMGIVNMRACRAEKRAPNGRFDKAK